MAVAAFSVAVLFVAALTLFAGFAFMQKKPLLMTELLVLPAVAIVLSFAARRVIRNSEGTRTGENLAKWAWWVAVLGGLCYVAYLFAIDFAIRSDAKGEMQKWMEHVNKSDEDDTYRAFYRTIPPGARNFAPTDTQKIQDRFRNEFIRFRNSDLMRLAQRNKGELKYTSDSVAWAYKPGMTECILTGTVKCAEGTFPVTVSLKGFEGVAGAESGGGRQWMIERPQVSGFIDEPRASRTPYGWLVSALEESGSIYGKLYVGQTLFGPSSHAYTYRAFVAEKGDLHWIEVVRDPLMQLAFAGPAAVALPNDYQSYIENHFYKLPGGAEPQLAQKERFKDSWNKEGIRPAGDRLKAPDGAIIDRESHLSITDKAVEIRVPIEIPVNVGGKRETARGHVVVESKDPALMEMLKRLKASADPAKGTMEFPADLRAELLERFKDPASPGQVVFHFRVARIESDMVPVIQQQQQGPPGRPGGM
jgi:hypothetical protein